MSSSSWSGTGPSYPPASAAGGGGGGSSSSNQLQRSGSGDRQKKPQSRQLLSCTKCRERKVKVSRELHFTHENAETFGLMHNVLDSVIERSLALRVVLEGTRRSVSSSSARAMTTAPSSSLMRFVSCGWRTNVSRRGCRLAVSLSRERMTTTMNLPTRRVLARHLGRRLHDRDASRRMTALTTSISARRVWPTLLLM